MEVSFEPGTRKFLYGDAAIKERKAQQANNSTQSQDNDRKQPGFYRKSAKLSETIFKDASDDVKRQLDDQDDDLDAINDAVLSMKAISGAIGNEVDRQSEQIDKLDAKTDMTSARLKHLNKKVGKIT